MNMTTTSSGQVSVADPQNTTSAVVNDMIDKKDDFSLTRPLSANVLRAPPDIQELFSRPVYIYSIPLGSLTTSYQNVAAISAFMVTESVKTKWYNFSLFRANFHVRVTVQASAYAYGRVNCSIITPYVQARSAVPPAGYCIHQAKGRNHVTLDIGMSSSAELTIPWTNCSEHWRMNTISGTWLSSVADCPYIQLVNETSLTDVSTGGTAAGLLSIHTWATDVDIGIPVPNLYTSEASKATSKGFISAPLSAVSNATHLLSSVPVIGRFSEAVSIGTGAASRIAALFGFSKPLSLNKETVFGAIPSSTGIGLTEGRKMTLDPNQAVYPDPSFSACSEDVLAMKNIIGRHSQVGSYNFTTGLAVNAKIFALPVVPYLVDCAGSASAVMLTPLAYGALTHTFWRGTLRFRINIIASKYHRGQVRIFWSQSSLLGVANTNQNTFNVVVDISSSTTVDVDVPWNCRDPYLPIMPFTSAGTGYDLQQSNGYIQMEVVSPLISPSASAPIYVTVDLAAGDDFELIQPTTLCMKKFSLYPYNAPTVSPPFVAPNLTAALVAGADTIEGTGYPVLNVYQSLSVSTSNVAVHSTVSTVLGESVYRDVNHLYMGERFNTFRTCCKRSVPGLTLIGQNTANTALIHFVPAFPVLPGSYYNGTAYYSPLSNWTFVSWFTVPFRGYRGSIRITCYPLAATPTATIGRPHYLLSNEYKFTRDTKLWAGLLPTDMTGLLQYFRSAGKGYENFNPSNQTESVEIPYMHNGAYVQTPFYGDPLFTAGVFEPGVLIVQQQSNQTANTVLYSAGEDWTPVSWVQIPYLYINYTVPSGTLGFASDGAGDVDKPPSDQPLDIEPTIDHEDDVIDSSDFEQEAEMNHRFLLRMKEQLKQKNKSSY